MDLRSHSAKVLRFWNTLGFDLDYYSCRIMVSLAHCIPSAMLTSCMFVADYLWHRSKPNFGSALSCVISLFYRRRRGHVSPLDCTTNTRGWRIAVRQRSHGRSARSPHVTSAPAGRGRCRELWGWLEMLLTVKAAVINLFDVNNDSNDCM